MTPRRGAGSAAVSSPPLYRLSGVLVRTEVQRAASSVVGRDFVQVLTDIPEAVESSRYVHSGDEVGERLAGTVELRLECGTVLTLRAGDGFLVPPGVADPRNLLSR